MLRGGHDSLYGSRRRVVAAGQVMVVNAGEVHDGAPLGEAGRISVLGHFAPELLAAGVADASGRSEEHTSELQSLMRISYAVFCLKKKKPNTRKDHLTTSKS